MINKYLGLRNMKAVLILVSTLFIQPLWGQDEAQLKGIGKLKHEGTHKESKVGKWAYYYESGELHS